MSEMLEQAFEKARRLPADEQDAIAAIILDEMEDEARWEEAPDQKNPSPSWHQRRWTKSEGGNEGP